MAKKKKVVEEDDDDLGDFDDDDFEIALPTLVDKKDKEKEVKPKYEEDALDLEDEESEDLGIQLPEVIDYKYVKPSIKKGQKENDYEVVVKGQSHGFCNILVKHLLEIKGVNIAAYKSTSIEPAKIFIRLEPGFAIKDILYKGMESLRDEVVQVQKVFEKLI
ncbi:MAG: RpoL/Rpb11 RNA polymerase subunit family protein [Promethearchaeota archaeon]